VKYLPSSAQFWSSRPDSVTSRCRRKIEKESTPVPVDTSDRISAVHLMSIVVSVHSPYFQGI